MAFKLTPRSTAPVYPTLPTYEGVGMPTLGILPLRTGPPYAHLRAAPESRDGQGLQPGFAPPGPPAAPRRPPSQAVPPVPGIAWNPVFEAAVASAQRPNRGVDLVTALLAEQAASAARAALPPVQPIAKVVESKEMRAFVCEECGATFPRKDRLNSHMLSHTGERPFKCSECGAGFGQKAHLRTHLRRHMGEKPFACDQCDFTFVTQVELKGHKLRKHSSGVEGPREGTYGDYVCEDCGSKWVSIYKLRVHRRTHTGIEPYQCELCGDAFSAKSALDLHKEVHADNTPFVCDKCGAGFRNTHGLMRHTNLGKYRCVQ